MQLVTLVMIGIRNPVQKSTEMLFGLAKRKIGENPVLFFLLSVVWIQIRTDPKSIGIVDVPRVKYRKSKMALKVEKKTFHDLRSWMFSLS
jgi:hypothetical protein